MGHLCPNRYKDWSVPQDWGQWICVNASFLSLSFFRIVEWLFSWESLEWFDTCHPSEPKKMSAQVEIFWFVTLTSSRRIHSGYRHSPLQSPQHKTTITWLQWRILRINSFHSSNSWKPEGIDDLQDNNGWILLHWVAQAGHHEPIELILSLYPVTGRSHAW